MSFIKFGFVLVCALLVSQASTGPVQETQLAKIVKEVLVGVTGVLDKVLIELDKVATSLSKDGLDSFQKKTVEVAFKVLDGIRQASADELKRIDANINADAKAVSKCLIANGPAIVNLILSYYNTTSICWNPALKPFIGSAEPLIADLKKVDEDVAKLAPGLDKCGNDICVVGIVRNVITEIKTIPDILKKDVPAIETAAKAFATSAASCLTKEADPWRKQSYELFNKIGTCIRT